MATKLVSTLYIRPRETIFENGQNSTGFNGNVEYYTMTSSTEYEISKIGRYGLATLFKRVSVFASLDHSLTLMIVYCRYKAGIDGINKQ